jgi:hypothetical protein
MIGNSGIERSARRRSAAASKTRKAGRRVGAAEPVRRHDAALPRLIN